MSQLFINQSQKEFIKFKNNMSHSNNGLFNNRRLNPGNIPRKNYHDSKINKINIKHPANFHLI